MHGGDNDSTGCIGAALYGALYGFEGVPSCNYRSLEYRQRSEEDAKKLFQKSQSLSHWTNGMIDWLISWFSIFFFLEIVFLVA